MADRVHGQTAARADLCRFLAACYYQPGAEFGEEKIFDSMLDAASRIHPALAAHAERLGEAFAAEDPQSLLIDYTRLFLGPSPILAKPYGSVWLGADETLMQDSTLAMLELYAKGGFEISEDFRELPDHIAAELEFLYLLLFRDAQSQLSGDATARAAVAHLRKRLMEEHLGRWVAPFTAAVSASAQSGFYRELARLTERFVMMEARALSVD